jgi:signal transduction histidine kinase
LNPLFVTLEPERLGRLVELGRSLVSELDLETLLQRILDVARELTGARYAALGVLDADHAGLERFLYSGIDEERAAQIGELPRGRGVLGVLISDPRPLRLEDVGEHESSYGSPAGHPPMTTFLGVPVHVRGAVFGNLYLADRPGGAFTPEDEEALVVLADWAAIALANASAHHDVRGRRDELERAVRAFEATTALARAVGGETDVDAVLDLVVKRARALLDGRTAVLFRPEGEELVAAAVAGHGANGAVPRTAIDRERAGPTLRDGRSEDLHDLPVAGALGARTAVWTALRFRGEALGVLTVYGDARFSEEDERLLTAFGASAASAIATAQNAAVRALRLSMQAAEEERRRWARELHDQTLQELGGLRMLLHAGRRHGGERLEASVDEAVELLGDAIAELRHLITELRPAALDQIGIAAALEALAGRMARQHDLHVELEVDLDYESGRKGTRHTADLEATVYRVAQEALTNVARHSGATTATVQVADQEGTVRLEVRDHGCGFTPEGTARGFGLVGMQERAALAGGRLQVESVPGDGTRVVAEFPAARRG